MVVRDGRYLPPTNPGFSAQLLPETFERFAFPHGAEWAHDATSTTAQEPTAKEPTAQEPTAQQPTEARS